MDRKFEINTGNANLPSNGKEKLPGNGNDKHYQPFSENSKTEMRLARCAETVANLLVPNSEHHATDFTNDGCSYIVKLHDPRGINGTRRCVRISKKNPYLKLTDETEE